MNQLLRDIKRQVETTRIGAERARLDEIEIAISSSPDKILPRGPLSIIFDDARRYYKHASCREIIIEIYKAFMIAPVASS